MECVVWGGSKNTNIFFFYPTSRRRRKTKTFSATFPLLNILLYGYRKMPCFKGTIYEFLKIVVLFHSYLKNSWSLGFVVLFHSHLKNSWSLSIVVLFHSYLKNSWSLDIVVLFHSYLKGAQAWDIRCWVIYTERSHLGRRLEEWTKKTFCVKC